jgi:hypothetical protein
MTTVDVLHLRSDTTGATFSNASSLVRNRDKYVANRTNSRFHDNCSFLCLPKIPQELKTLEFFV